MRSLFDRGWHGFAPFAMGLALSLVARASEPLPNIVVMMADDMGLGDTSAYQDWSGNSDEEQVTTPAMERLARMGIRFTDAHSPSSRCTATRQALLTGRYTWRTRLKYSVLWGPQGDPLIEPGRPTLATVLKQAGYRTGMTGKWHCGLTYRDTTGAPISGYENVDLTKGIADGPINHGFDFFHGTSRSHPTSKDQGWLFGDRVTAAAGGKNVDRSKYILTETGPTNFRMGMQFLHDHLQAEATRRSPFFLYYACHSNHTSHDPCESINGVAVRGASHPGGKRSDFIYENDVALGLLMDFLTHTDDPRRPGAKLMENTLLIFTSDNGAESARKTATGPIRSNKASCYEGGHRVPFIATWKLGGIGDGDSQSAGQSSDFPICHVDLLATFRDLVGAEDGAGGEDSMSILSALQGHPPATRTPIIHNDHKEGALPRKANDPAAAWTVIRSDDLSIDEVEYAGQWKLFVDHTLAMGGELMVKELYELRSDPMEERNRIDEPALQSLVQYLADRLRAIHEQGTIRAPFAE